MNERKRQHPLWIILKIGLSIREVIIPIIYFFIINLGSKSNFVKYGSIALIVYIIIRIITILLEWRNNTYLFTDQKLELNEGRLISKKRYITLNRVQSVQQHTSFFHRIFNLTSLNISTGTTGDNATVQLEMITLEEAEKIKKQLNEKIQQKEATQTEVREETKQPLTTHYKMSLNEIILISITSLYFLASIPIIMSIYIKLEDIFSLERYTTEILAMIKHSVFLMTFTIIGILAILTVIGIFIMYIRFGNYTVQSNEHRIYISRGVFTKTTFSIPKNRVNGLTIDKGFIRQFFNLAEVQLIIVGDLAEENEISTTVLFPFISEKRAYKLIPEILPNFTINKNMKKLPNESLFAIFIRPSYLLVIVTVLVFFFWPEYWFIPVILTGLIIASRFLEYKRTKYKVYDQSIQIQTGSFATSLFVSNCNRINQLQITESWIQQKLRLASLIIATRGQTVHYERISNLPLLDAKAYSHWYIDEFTPIKDNTNKIQTNI